jgi:hypothetical protein
LKKSLKTAVAVVAASGLAVAAALAVSSSHPTHVFLDGSDTITGAGLIVLDGHLESNSKKCLPNRKVKVRAGYENESTTRDFDVARSSRNGAYAAVGPDQHGLNTISTATIKAPKKIVGTHRHPVTCKAGRTTAN